ncbi:MAG: NnrS family protein [Rhizomicrobium sp.]
MLTAGTRILKGSRHALWSMGFRPFFLLAALWSVLALALWIVMLATAETLPTRFDPVDWHIHAMLFGFVFAAMAGFLLTAIPSWTGRPPIRGTALFALVLLWLFGRLACVFSAWCAPYTAPLIDVAFPVVLATIAVREILAAHNWRNIAIPAPLAMLAIADILMHLESIGIGIPPGLGWRLALAAIVAMISVIGGRIIPAFTRNWLELRGATVLPAPAGIVDRASLGCLHAGLFAWALLPAFLPVGAILLAASALNVWRLARWRGLAVRSEPLLAILHVGYGWVALGAGLLGASAIWAAVPQAAAIHALTAGAIGTMVLAIMTRVALGHTGRALEADRVTAGIYVIVVLSALFRIAAAFAIAPSSMFLDVSAALWTLAFVLFGCCYGPMLLSPRLA